MAAKGRCQAIKQEITMKRIMTAFWRWWYRHHPEPSRFTKDEALAIAREHKLDAEVLTAMKHGYTPDEALQEWDIYPYGDQ